MRTIDRPAANITGLIDLGPDPEKTRSLLEAIKKDPRIFPEYLFGVSRDISTADILNGQKPTTYGFNSQNQDTDWQEWEKQFNFFITYAKRTSQVLIAKIRTAEIDQYWLRVLQQVIEKVPPMHFLYVNLGQKESESSRKFLDLAVPIYCPDEGRFMFKRPATIDLTLPSPIIPSAYDPNLRVESSRVED